MSYIISEIYSLQGTSNNFEMLMLSESWSGKIQSILIWFISIHLKSSLLNRANRTNSNRGTIMNRNPLFQRLANWAIISIALLPVTNYLPWWRTMIYWTWTSRLAWYHMNEYILYRTAMWQRTLKWNKYNHFTFLFCLLITDPSFLIIIRTQFCSH